MRQRVEQYWAAAADVTLLALFAYWFAATEPERVFLVEHLGAGPLDTITRGRYWMAGLVACGYLLLLSTVAMPLLRHVGSSRVRLRWPIMWGLAAPLIAIGTSVVITRWSIAPVPVADALGCTAFALAGTALVAACAVLAYEDIRMLARQALASAGIVPLLAFTRVVELPERGLISPAAAVIILLACVALPPIWALLLRKGCRRLGKCQSPWPLLVGAFTETYLLAPVAHHLLLTPPGYPYITAASNLFANSWWLQGLTLALAVVEAYVATLIMKRNSFSGGTHRDTHHPNGRASG